MVKVTRSSKPVKRYTRRKDALGRTYTLDKETGKRASRSLWERQQKRIAKTREREAIRVESKRLKPAKPRAKATPKPRAKATPKARAKAIAKARSKAKAIRVAIDNFLDTREPFAPLLWAELVATVRPIAEQIEEPEFFRPFPEMGMPLRDKVKRYPRVQRATVNAVALAELENLRIGPLIEAGTYEPSKEELIRAHLMSAYVGQNPEYANFETAAGAMAEEYDMEVREVYQLFFSPDVA
jgi:hypothetical protein